MTGIWISGAALAVSFVGGLLAIAFRLGALAQRIERMEARCEEWMPRELCISDMSRVNADVGRVGSAGERLEALLNDLRQDLATMRARSHDTSSS